MRQMTHTQPKAMFLTTAIALGLLVLAALLHVPTAAAEPPDFVLQMPEGQVTVGSGAGELSAPRGIAGDPDTGHVYISDVNNARISEYTAWGSFVKAWGWGVRDGAEELQTCGPAQPEVDPAPSLCQQGSEGAGRGQLARQEGIAVDPAGNVYVLDRENLRVQKFGPGGEFVLMFGGEVNETKVNEGAPSAERNVCPIAPADVCQAGVPGEAPSHLADASIGDYIDYSPVSNAIVVGDKDRIQIFNLDGTFKEEIPFEGELAAFEGLSVNGLDVDSTGNIYFSLTGREDLYKLSAAGVPLAPGKPEGSSFAAVNPLAVAVDVDGGVYAIDDPPIGGERVLKFDAAGVRLVPTQVEAEQKQFFPYVPFQGPILSGLATNVCAGSEQPGNVYVSFYDFQFSQLSYVRAYGTGPVGCEPPPLNPPQIVAQFATEVGRQEAVVKAQINPRFWQDATYYVEYGAGKCSEGGCAGKQPLPPAQLTTNAISSPVTTGSVVLEGLQAGTTYHYRFVAESSGGGPTVGEEASFRTPAAPTPSPPCANDAFRTGPSAQLPDCRAYEMVSPLDKGNADVAPWLARNNQLPHTAELAQASPSGDRFAYTSPTAFGDAEGAPFVIQYLADRMDGGWGSRSITPPRTTPPFGVQPLLNSEFHGFSPDLCMAWMRHASLATLAEGAIEEYPNIYRRDNCSQSPSFQAVTTMKPEATAVDDYFELRTQGFSDDGAHTIFTANGKLDPDAPLKAKLELLLYEHTPEGLRFVCYLPNGNPSPQACAAGTGVGTNGGSRSSAHNAISADGSRIFWSAYTGLPGPGQIYVRIDGQTTFKVSGSKASDPAWYWTAADDGSKAIFEFAAGPLKDQLYELDVDKVLAEEPGAARLIAKGVLGPLGASEDASRIYFASTEDRDGVGPATAGARNLYFYEADEEGGEGTFRFVMALAEQDIGGSETAHAPIEEIPADRSARVSADGLHVVLSSSVSPTPTGYDNLDARSGGADEEVYLYDAIEDKVTCVSCNPTGARPTGEAGVAARIQGWEALLHAPHVLSEDGSRVFFESREGLVPHDTNAIWDVYQWEEEAKGSCTEARNTFSEVTQGCIDLISSGDSAAKSTFLDADPSGDNVFIGTQSSLLPQDYGLNDVYVARVDGGFPQPTRPAGCEGEACQGPLAAPDDPTPASSSGEYAGNVTEPPCPKGRVLRRGRCAQPRCPRGERRAAHRGKSRCVKRQGSKRKRAQRERRRSG